MRRTRGFTLLEILIAMSLFTFLGFAVVVLMKNGVDMWLQGTRGTAFEDRVEMSLPRLEEDLRMVLVPAQRDSIPFDKDNPDPEKEPPARPPRNRFVSGYVNYRFGEVDYPCRYLAFVRDLSGLGELETYAKRAGQNPTAEAYIDGKNDEEEFKKNLHLPTGGAVEVLWIWLPQTDRPGVGDVYRAYRSPIGGKGTLLDPKNFQDFEKLDRVIDPQPMFQNVLLFDVYFWTQYTTTWEWSNGEPSIRRRPQSAEEFKAGRQRCGPSRTWDSTRGVMKAADDGFWLGRGPESFNFSGDDIWPRMVRVEFALLEEETTLAGTLSSGDSRFVVDVGDFAAGRGEIGGAYMKIGPEWVRIQARDGARGDTFLIGRRAQRGTVSRAHAAGTAVYFGSIFDVTISIPSFRDDNN